jgi:periplasmic protein CpxP/Spy
MSLSKKLPALLLSIASLLCFSTATRSFAQDWHGGDRDGMGGPPGGPMEHAFRVPEHRWWDNPRIAQQIGLTDDQKKKMDEILQQHRLQLIDLHAALEKQEVLLRPMLGADQLDESKVLSQIDAIAQARAELEKANARMLFGIRKVLTPDQWKKLQTIVRAHAAEREHRGWNGPGGERWHRPNGPAGPGGPNGPPPPDGGSPAPASPNQ